MGWGRFTGFERLSWIVWLLKFLEYWPRFDGGGWVTACGEGLMGAGTLGRTGV